MKPSPISPSCCRSNRISPSSTSPKHIPSKNSGTVGATRGGCVWRAFPNAEHWDRIEGCRIDERTVDAYVARIDPVILHIQGEPRRRERYGATGLLLQAIS